MIYTANQIADDLIPTTPKTDLGIIVCIPCYNEREIVSSIESLLACDQPSCVVEIIILINGKETDTDQIKSTNKKAYSDLQKINSLENISIFPILIHEISSKKAGVGFARRLAMDEAARRLNLSTNKLKIIAAFDADSFCDKNYLIALENYFNKKTKLAACSIYFEHPLIDLPVLEKNAIIDYELHLRYFIHMQRLIDLPFAFQTVGSSMAVRAETYTKYGGMNVRQAGEDFYFLHKFIKNNVCGDLTDTCIYPSARISDRVPFGTGKAIGDIIQSKKSYKTYNPKSFLELNKITNNLEKLYNLKTEIELQQVISENSTIVASYFSTIKIENKIIEIKNNVASFEAFKKRFFQFFDAFKLMKYLHYCRDHHFEDISMNEAVNYLFDIYKIPKTTLEESLIQLRALDKKLNAKPL